MEDQPEDFLIPAVLWGEARGESTLGKLAILWVIRNRAAKRSTSMKEEILRPRQFSSFNPGDPNQPRLLAAPGLDPRGWSACEMVAEVFPHTLDITNGADHYYNFHVVAPPWGRGHAQWQERAVIGNHCFGICP